MKTVDEAKDSEKLALEFKADKLSSEKYNEAKRLLASALAKFENALFIEAEQEAKEAKKLLIVALTERKNATLKSGEEALAENCWKDALAFANKILNIDPTNASALKIMTAAEQHLPSKLSVVTIVDGVPVNGMISVEPMAVSVGEKNIELERDKKYTLSVRYEKGWDVWTATQTIDVDWSGKRDVTIVLENLGKVVKLPGNVPLELVLVEAGRFQMGSHRDEEGRSRIETQHWVTLTKNFWIGKYEVTQEQYEVVMKVNPSKFAKGGNYPVDNVKWDQAMEFCRRLNELLYAHIPPGYEFSLPTEAQWEYAARGGKYSRRYRYSGSNDLDKVAWYEDNSDDSTHPVGQKVPNELGIYDMSGNVWEWCNEWAGYYDTQNTTDPIGKRTMAWPRIHRGGGWKEDEEDCRVAIRLKTNGSRTYFGFRLALVPIR